MICVYFFLPSRGGAIIAYGEHSFPSEPRLACRLFRRPARQPAIRGLTVREAVRTKGRSPLRC
jgi:hypothetical protein